MPVGVRLAAVVILASLAPSGFAATIQGVVIEDHSNAPVLSAGVRIHKAGARALAADLETDSRGRFEAPGLAAGEYLLDISKPNFVAASLRLRLLDAASDATVPVRLIRTGVITGQVTDGSGKPIPGVSVFAMPKPAQGGALRPRLETGQYANADGSGRYRLYNLAPGQYFIAASYGASTFAVGSTGRAATSASLGSGFLLYPGNTRPELLSTTGGEEHRNIDFHVAPVRGASVSGRIQSPLAGAHFWLALALLEQPGLAVAVTPAQPDGAFRFTGIPPGAYHLFASGPVWGRAGRGVCFKEEPFFARTQVDISGQDIEGLTIAPAKGRSVRFTLQAEAGANCAQAAQLSLSALEDWAADLERRVPIAPDKPVTVLQLAPARYAVSVTGLTDPCFAPPATVFDLSQSAAPDAISLRALAAGAIRGRVDAPGRRPSDFSIVLLPDLDTATGVRLAVPDSEFRFAFTGLRPGAYCIAARGPGAAQSGGMVELELPAGSTVDVDLVIPGRPTEAKP